jgi:predicted nucleic acid-binding protein
MPPTVVCDASVALKWFHAEGESEVEPSRNLLDAHADGLITLFVLDLTPYEIGNALLHGRLNVGPGRTAAVLEALVDICDQVAPEVQQLGEAARLADEHQLTLYDAAYAAVARARGGELATMDEALLGAGLGRRPSEIASSLSLAGSPTD